MNQHHIVLVSLGWIRERDPRQTLGHASILASLMNHPEIEATPLQFSVNEPGFSRERMLSSVLAALSSDQTILALGVYVWNEAHVQWLLREIRRSGFHGRIVLGGPQVSYAPCRLESLYPDADFFIRGYAEEALPLLPKGDRKAPEIICKGMLDTGAQADADLERLPSPHLRGVLSSSSIIRMETQRGCIYRCTFCQHREAGPQSKCRAFSRERLEAEIHYFSESNISRINVLDPIFNTHRAHALWVLGQFAAQKFRGQLSFQCRFESITEEFLDACSSLSVCLEFGLQTIQEAEMKCIERTNNLPKVEQAIRWLNESRIPFEVSLIYGLPQQTLSSFQASIDWCRDHGVPKIRAYPLMLLRGTPIERNREVWSLVENDDPIPLVVSSSSFNRAEWEKMNEIARALA
ncbi:MAG: radical SAM protein [Planctomycetes bacterium]|nr:radical SAM protein [Planctomycetota bacterium]